MQSVALLVRGLSALFWGLPLALVLSVQAGTSSWFRALGPVGLLGPVGAYGLLLYAVWLLGSFQKQERIWIAAVDRLRILAMTNLGLAPFLYWHRRFPEIALFASSIVFLAVFSILFLLAVNAALRRLVAMLPDETLRVETAVFTTLNGVVLLLLPSLVVANLVIRRLRDLPEFLRYALEMSGPLQYWLLLFMILLPVAITMSLLWKTKEAILTSVFNDLR